MLAYAVICFVLFYYFLHSLLHYKDISYITKLLYYMVSFFMQSFLVNDYICRGEMTHRTRSPADCLVVATSLITKGRVVHAALLHRRRNSIRTEINENQTYRPSSTTDCLNILA